MSSIWWKRTLKEYGSLLRRKRLGSSSLGRFLIPARFMAKRPDSSSNKMPAAVKDAIAVAVETFGKRTRDEALQYIEALVTDGRLIEECWS